MPADQGKDHSNATRFGEALSFRQYHTNPQVLGVLCALRNVASSCQLGALQRLCYFVSPFLTYPSKRHCRKPYLSSLSFLPRPWGHGSQAASSQADEGVIVDWGVLPQTPTPAFQV